MKTATAISRVRDGFEPLCFDRATTPFVRTLRERAPAHTAMDSTAFVGAVMKGIFWYLLLWSWTVVAAPSVALHYGAHPPLDELKAFDIVVVEPEHGPDPLAYRTTYSELFAYVSVGEVLPARPYFKALPAGVLMGRNADWDAEVIDLAHPAWSNFLVDKVVQPLWAKGFRGFFLDTLDSYRLAEKFNEAAQQKGLVRIIETLHQRFPGIRLILNRGFEVLPQVKGKVMMIAAESLFRGWDAKNKRYVEVSANDSEWLLDRLREARDVHGVKVLSIDYVTPTNRALARETAQRIKALGIVPYVTDFALHALGVGQVEVVPRKILLLYDGREAPTVHQSQAVRFAMMPLQHLGYAVELVDINAGLPDHSLDGRLAGIVLWLNGRPAQPQVLSAWVQRQRLAGVRVAAIGQLAPFDTLPPQQAGLATPEPPVMGKITTVVKHPMFGFEAPSKVERRAIQPVKIASPDGRPLLRFADARGENYDAAAIMPWGGFVLEPYVVASVPGTEQARWVVDPFAFFREALKLLPMPVPDTTTENGRRLMFVHIDGDGFPSLSERPGSPIAGRVLLEEVIAPYRIPTTLSVIEGEVSPDGVYPELSAEAEAVAKRAFALPFVEIASHTYSHPFDWSRAARGERAASKEDLYHLELPGYTVDLEREIGGSIEYIQGRLAPKGKRVEMILWSGDAEIGPEALHLARRAGLLNMNGGNTIITRKFPSVTAVSGLGVLQNGLFQTYAPIMNENLYTNLWAGPFYGFERVIETLAMTEVPRRLKPINIYFHSYSASKRASLNALHKVYRWALAQSPHLIYASEFVRKSNDFNVAVLARDGPDWIYRGHGELRTLRAPAELGYPDLASSVGLAGYRPGAEGRYLHLAGEELRLRFVPELPRLPYLYEANARLTAWDFAGSAPNFALRGHQPIELVFAAAEACTFIANGQPVAAQRLNNLHRVRLNHASATIQARCNGR